MLCVLVKFGFYFNKLAIFIRFTSVSSKFALIINHKTIQNSWNRHKKLWIKGVFIKVSFALCSRNFQNVKLRLDFVEIWQSSRHPDFTWNQILANSNDTKMSFWQCLEVLNFDFLVNLRIFQALNLPKFKVQSL